MDSLTHRGAQLPTASARRTERSSPPNNSLQLTRLACGKMGGALPAGMRDNESTGARAAGQLSSRPLGGDRRHMRVAVVQQQQDRPHSCSEPFLVKTARRILQSRGMTLSKSRFRSVRPLPAI
jgi:hypothetical protein